MFYISGERPFKCEVCEATFVYPEHFKKHRRIHTGEKPFRCEVCHKAFNSRDNRNAHRFVHSDKKPYECLVCITSKLFFFKYTVTFCKQKKLFK